MKVNEVWGSHASKRTQMLHKSTVKYCRTRSMIHWKHLIQKNDLFTNRTWLVLSWMCQEELERMSGLSVKNDFQSVPRTAVSYDFIRLYSTQDYFYNTFMVLICHCSTWQPKPSFTFIIFKIVAMPGLSKIYLLCSTEEEKKTFGFKTTLGWVNDLNIFNTLILQYEVMTHCMLKG